MLLYLRKVGTQPMKKQYRRVGSKSKVLIIRVSEAMEIDLQDICEKMEMSMSDFTRIAIRNAISYYSKRGIALAVNNAELEQYQRDFQLALGKKELKEAPATQFIPEAPSDEEIEKILNEQKKRIANK